MISFSEKIEMYISMVTVAAYMSEFYTDESKLRFRYQLTV